MAKVLVVDDDPDIIFMIKSMLEKNGHSVTTASDGHRALKAVQNDAPDLMIADLTMPGMDGWRLCMKVRQEEHGQTMPIIVLSGLLAKAEIQADPHDPYNIMLGKPFDIMKLMDKVKELLS